MATFTCGPNTDATNYCSSSGVAAAFAKITNTTTGVVVYNGSYNNSSLQVFDYSPVPGSNNNYSCAYSSTLNGAPVGTLTSAATPNITAGGSISAYDNGGGWINISWAYPGNGNSTLSPHSVNVWQTINGVQTLIGSMNYPQTSVSTYIGYSTTASITVAYYYDYSRTGGIYTAQVSRSTSVTTGPPPPPAPNPATNGIITADDQSNSVSMSWTASAGGASGYYVYRSINGAGYTYLGSTAGTTWTDSSSGSVRPITYEILAYNSNAGGTTTAGSYAYATTLAPVTNTTTERWNVNVALTQGRNIQWIQFNVRIIPNAILAAAGVSGTLPNVQDDPYNADATYGTGTGGPVDVRLGMTDPGQVSMSNPVNTQKFVLLLRAP